ncbi:MAG: VOC family protein [Candidatus Limnocylindrales bacterium]
MTQSTATALANKPAWVDLASSDAAASRDFYGRLFGWDVQVNPDPQYGGYALAKVDGSDVAGIGPQMTPGSPTAWMVYIGTDDIDGLATKVQKAGGTVIAPAFDVGDQGRMAVYQDPSGAFISAWQPTGMPQFRAYEPNSFGWAELNARGADTAIAFYHDVFGWAHTTEPMGEGQPPYTTFTLDGERVAGGMEMNPMVPAEVPSYWMAYFDVDDVDAAYQRAIEGGAHELVAPGEFPGGRFAIVSDPLGAAFGLLKLAPR